jgi:hypothetical protein
MRLAFEKLAHLIDTIVNPQPNVLPLHGLLATAESGSTTKG